MNKNGLPPNIANNRPIPEVPGAYKIKELQITIGKVHRSLYFYNCVVFKITFSTPIPYCQYGTAIKNYFSLQQI